MRFQFQKQYLNNHKLLMQEWDYNKNEQLGLDPGGLSCGSQKKAWWICPKGHKYEDVIRSRAIRGDGCPYCSGHRAISGVNDFATLYPKIAAEWDYKKNGELGIAPDTVSYASQKRLVGFVQKDINMKQPLTRGLSEEMDVQSAQGIKQFRG